jgi:hypothetical protein
MKPTSAECQRALDMLGPFGSILTIKLYRVTLERPGAVPLIPCLDHEAMLHQTVAPHAAVYVQERASGDLHEVVFIPAERRVGIDTVSTWGESSDNSRGRLLSLLADTLPEYRIVIQGPSWWRGDRRVADTCRARISLRDVLLGTELDAMKTEIERLQTIGTLMEKESRVGSWAVRTITAPILASVGVVTYQVLGLFTGQLGETGVSTLRYLVISTLGALFLYYGLKAVHLTEMANRVWKRAAEYNLIVAERRRLGRIS